MCRDQQVGDVRRRGGLDGADERSPPRTPWPSAPPRPTPRTAAPSGPPCPPPPRGHTRHARPRRRLPPTRPRDAADKAAADKAAADKAAADKAAADKAAADKAAADKAAADKAAADKAAADKAAADKAAAAAKAAAKAAADAAAAKAKAAAATPTYANNLDGWIKQAVSILNANGTYVSYNAIYQAAMHESAGNPSAVNGWDSNAAKGTPSIGLLQVIAPTFNAYALPGHNNIYNPVDNIIAGVRYAAAVYGSLDSVVAARCGGSCWYGVTKPNATASLVKGQVSGSN